MNWLRKFFRPKNPMHEGWYTVFSAREAIPEWLLAQDPMGPKAKPGKLSFGNRTVVFEAEDTYFVIPIGNTVEPVVLYDGCENVRLVPGGRKVRMVGSQQLIAWSAEPSLTQGG